MKLVRTFALILGAAVLTLDELRAQQHKSEEAL